LAGFLKPGKPAFILSIVNLYRRERPYRFFLNHSESKKSCIPDIFRGKQVLAS
jgi:hypothetical protein